MAKKHIDRGLTNFIQLELYKNNKAFVPQLEITNWC